MKITKIRLLIAATIASILIPAIAIIYADHRYGAEGVMTVLLIYIFTALPLTIELPFLILYEIYKIEDKEKRNQSIFVLMLCVYLPVIALFAHDKYKQIIVMAAPVELHHKVVTLPSVVQAPVQSQPTALDDLSSEAWVKNPVPRAK